jgi:hypothetical protein
MSVFRMVTVVLLSAMMLTRAATAGAAFSLAAAHRFQPPVVI